MGEGPVYPVGIIPIWRGVLSRYPHDDEYTDDYPQGLDAGTSGEKGRKKDDERRKNKKKK